MEDILASIKRIIADDNRAVVREPQKGRPVLVSNEGARIESASLAEDAAHDPEEILELVSPLSADDLPAHDLDVENILSEDELVDSLELTDALEAQPEADFTDDQPVAEIEDISAEDDVASDAAASEIASEPVSRAETAADLVRDFPPASRRAAPVAKEAPLIVSVEEVAPMPSTPTPASATPAASGLEALISDTTTVASRRSLAALSSMLVKPEEGSDNTLDGLVRELLKPMMKDWLDQNLPTLVEKMVEKEIGRITGRIL